MATFIQQATAEMVSAAGFPATEIECAEDARSKLSAELDRNTEDRLHVLSEYLTRLQRTSYRVTLKSNITLKNVDLATVLSLPNVDDRQIRSIHYSNDFYEYNMELKWAYGRYSSAATIDLRGSYELVDRFEREIKNRLKITSHPWKILRTSRTKSALFWSSYLILLFVLFRISTPIMRTLNHHTRIGASDIYDGLIFAFAIAWLLSWPLGETGSKLIDRLVPSVEFRIGGGISISKSNVAALNILFWTVPVCGIALPLLAAWIAKLAFG